MEKLIVKNFGPIKDAEIDLTKYVVFIGDTSTGKSVLAKLIAIFRDNDLISSYALGSSESFIKLLEYYNIKFISNTTQIIYNNFEKKIEVEFNNDGLRFKKNRQVSLIGDHDFKNADLLKIINDLNVPPPKDSEDSEEYYTKFMNALENINKYKNRVNFSLPIYIPAERILTSFVGASIFGLWANNVALPNCFKDFAAKFEVAKKEVIPTYYEEFKLYYIFKNNTDYIVFNNEEIELSQASSGLQSLIPLLLVFEYETKYSFLEVQKNILVEEPELNLFPIKQKYIIEYFIANLFNSINNLIITTHSPYILSVLDTLMLAKNTFNEHPDLKEEITAIVSEDKWIDYDDISVYEVRNDGTIKSIKNEEFKSIDTNAIDGVSDIISEQFDKLTELRYAQ